MTLVDTNVLLDVVTDDPIWAQWSLGQLDAAALKGPIAINAIVHAELSVRFGRIEDLKRVVAQAGGARTGVLPDFFIGARAAIKNGPL